MRPKIAGRRGAPTVPQRRDCHHIRSTKPTHANKLSSRASRCSLYAALASIRYQAVARIGNMHAIDCALCLSHMAQDKQTTDSVLYMFVHVPRQEVLFTLQTAGLLTMSQSLTPETAAARPLDAYLLAKREGLQDCTRHLRSSRRSTGRVSRVVRPCFRPSSRSR